MILYHGTTEGRARLMLLQGIHPRKSRRPNHPEVPSSRHHVYLTNTYGLLYATNAGKGRPAVVAIDTDRLDPALLNADEDALEQTERGHDGFDPAMTVIDRVRHYRNEIDKHTFDWQLSLKALGTCAYRGTIPPGAITKVISIDREKQRWLLINAVNGTATIKNHRFAGREHKAALLWAMGADTLPPELQPRDFGTDISDSRIRWEFRWPPSPDRDGIETMFEREPADL